MKVLVLYDSVFGNTEKVAQAIGNALGSAPDVETRRVRDVQPGQLAGLQLLVVGSPTRGLRPTPAVTDFIKSIPSPALQGVRVAAFDTRLSAEEADSALLRQMMNWFGYAAEKIAGRLQKKGGTLVVPPEGFIVKGAEGPMQDGELERAAAWARRLGVSSYVK
jgi:flavodoxin I